MCPRSLVSEYADSNNKIWESYTSKVAIGKTETKTFAKEKLTTASENQGDDSL